MTRKDWEKIEAIFRELAPVKNKAVPDLPSPEAMRRWIGIAIAERFRLTNEAYVAFMKAARIGENT